MITFNIPPADPSPTTFMGSEESRIVEYYRQIKQSQWWSPGQLRRWQFGQIARLVAHARKHVPYYADKLDGLKLGPDGGIDEVSWRTLPVLTKEQVRSQPAQFRSRHLEPGVSVHSEWTSGSTGVPLEVLTTSDFWSLFRAIKLRMLQWHRYELGGKLCEIRRPRWNDDLLGPVLRQKSWEWPVGKLFKTGEHVMLSVHGNVASKVAFLEAEQPDYLTIFPSSLWPVLRAFQRSGKRLPSLRLVRTFTEQLDPELRHECRETFGVPLVDCYGSSETGLTAIQCPDHEHYHVQGEMTLIEVLAPDGTPCGPGEAGRLIVTPLHAHAMPLLRYEIGDYAELGGPCPCGRGLPVLNRFLGRKRIFLTLPSGEEQGIVHCKEIFKALHFIRQFQVVQKTLTDLEVKLVTERPLAPSESDLIVGRLRKQVGSGFNIRLTYVDHLPLLPGGKFMDFVSDLEPRS